MKKVLIINLKKADEILLCGHLINSLKKDAFINDGNKDSQNIEIEMLIYKEYSNVAKVIDGLYKLHSIDRQEILALKQNSLFSDSFALEAFYNAVSPLKKDWDTVINFSQDAVANFLATFLTNNKTTSSFIGTRVNEYNVIESSSYWTAIKHETLKSNRPHSFLHSVELSHLACVLPIHAAENLLISNPKHDITAQENFEKIREDHQNFGNEIRIVGIKLKGSRKIFDLSFETLKETIDFIFDDVELFPILIISPDDAERKLAIDLNKEFDNKLITVEADYLALSSVLKNIDILITPDSPIKHLADLSSLPVIEISKDNNQFFSSGTIGHGNLILSKCQNNYQEDIISGKDILLALDVMLGKRNATSIQLTPTISLYQVNNSNNKIFYEYLAGDKNIFNEISRYMTYYFVHKINEPQETKTTLLDIPHYMCTNKHQISSWIDHEKSLVTDITKSLLATLRSLKKSQQDKAHARDFIVALDQLLSFAETEDLMQIPLLIFKSKIENLTNTTREDNIKTVEKLLYGLKNDIQHAISCVYELENFVRKLFNDQLINKNKNLESIHLMDINRREAINEL